LISFIYNALCGAKGRLARKREIMPIILLINPTPGIAAPWVVRQRDFYTILIFPDVQPLTHCL
jgi:hypothetical protein